MDAIALPSSDLPVALVEQHGLERFVHDRGGEREIRFMRRARQPILPVWHAGQLLIVAWGCRCGPLPKTGLTWQKTLDAGDWGPYQPELVEIPAAAGLHNGIWYPIRRGVRGLLVESPAVAAYVLVEPSTYYYQVMTRSRVMPVLIGEQI